MGEGDSFVGGVVVPEGGAISRQSVASNPSPHRPTPTALPVSTPEARGLQVVRPMPRESYSGRYSSCSSQSMTRIIKGKGTCAAGSITRSMRHVPLLSSYGRDCILAAPSLHTEGSRVNLRVCSAVPAQIILQDHTAACPGISPIGQPGPIRSSRSATRHASSICSRLHSLVPQ